MPVKFTGSGKIRSAGIAEQAVSAAMELFGGGAHSPVSFAGVPYPVAGSVQLKIGGEDVGLGNCLPEPALFAGAEGLFREVMPERTLPAEAYEARRFSFACGNADRVSTAVQVIFALIRQRNVHKFIILVKNAAEREAIRHSLTALAAYFANVYGCPAPGITVYDSSHRETVRRFVCASGGHILLINRESFDRDANLFRRPCAMFSGSTPLELITPGWPVVITLSRSGTELSRLLGYLPMFSPLCTLAFLIHPDEKGITVPVFRPGTRNMHPEPEEDPMQLKFT